MTPVHHQNHATWECKYHVVFIPKYRKKAIFGVTKKIANWTSLLSPHRSPSQK